MFCFCRIAYIEFKTEAIAEKALEETQGSDVQGRSIIVDFTGDKSRQGGRGEKSATPGPCAMKPDSWQASFNVVCTNSGFLGAINVVQCRK